MPIRRGLVLFCAAASLLLHARTATPRPSDYDKELEEIRERISAIEEIAFRTRIEAKERVTRYAYLLYRRASMTGRFADLQVAERAIDWALREVGPLEALYLLRAQLDFKLHRLARTKEDLEFVPGLADRSEVRLLRGDIDLQEGRYEGALQAYEAVIRRRRGWESLARLAYLKFKTGDVVGAEETYLQAQDEITAKEMRSYAWVELQRGILSFDCGHYERALARYEHADRAYSGDWLIEEHIAEALDRLGRTEDAEALYRDIIARTQNPEIVSALAAIVQRRDYAAAAKLYEEGGRLFEERYRLYPEAAVGHWIQHLLSATEASPRLLQLAEENHRLRPNAESKLLLARVHFKLNDLSGAGMLLAEILETPWRTREIATLARQIRSHHVGEWRCPTTY